METVILKISLCSSLLIAIYYLFLQKEKMFRFNRFYLLFALIFSYVIPFVKINLPAISEKKNQLIFEEITTQQLIQKTDQASDFNWMNLILMIYILVSIILIIKSLVSIRKILKLKGTDINYHNQNVKLIEKDLPPFSFWNKIYLSKKHFEDQIDHRIFLHEKTHLIQKHSLDLILVEILQAISWFNPAIYFYKKAIKDNHEFLADEVIVRKEFNIKDYQNLILAEVLNAQNLSFVNQFNFNNTKKRFIMMTTKRSKLEKFKKLFAVSAFAGLSILFVQKVYASEVTGQKENEKPAVATLVDEKDYTESNRRMMEMYKNELKKERIPRAEIVAEVVVMDTIPANKTSKTRKLKENELPIPPPPPPASNSTAAQFPEGINSLRMSFSNIFDSSKFVDDTKNKGTFKTNIYIRIDENGKTTDVRAEGPNTNFNTEAVRAMKVATENVTWKPATEEGKAAATVFQLPITMNFH